MIYKAIGLMSGSSLDGLDIAYVHFQETGGKWSFEIMHAQCYPYPPQWVERLSKATSLLALDYLLLHADYGHYTGELVNRFISQYELQHKVHLVASHGHTSFHLPAHHMTAQLGDGAAIAAVTGLPVVADLRALDVALGGQGAPIVPIGEKLLLLQYDLLLNLGGIANVSAKTTGDYIAFDICPANRVLNMLATNAGKAFDEGGNLSATGTVHEALLHQLNNLAYYRLPYPKSLSNDFGTTTLYPLIMQYGLATVDALRTYTEHICLQTERAVSGILAAAGHPAPPGSGLTLLVTGGGAFNSFLVERLQQVLAPLAVETVVPETNLICFKEALIMALIGVLRWREEYTILPSVTGAHRSSIGGALWLGGEA